MAARCQRRFPSISAGPAGGPCCENISFMRSEWRKREGVAPAAEAGDLVIPMGGTGALRGNSSLRPEKNPRDRWMPSGLRIANSASGSWGGGGARAVRDFGASDMAARIPTLVWAPGMNATLCMRASAHCWQLRPLIANLYQISSAGPASKAAVLGSRGFRKPESAPRLGPGQGRRCWSPAGGPPPWGRDGAGSTWARSEEWGAETSPSRMEEGKLKRRNGPRSPRVSPAGRWPRPERIRVVSRSRNSDATRSPGRSRSRRGGVARRHK